VAVKKKRGAVTRSAKQLANDKRLGRMAKKRAAAKRTGRKATRKKNPKRATSGRAASKKSHLWIVFRAKANGTGVGFLSIAITNGKLNFVVPKGQAILFKEKKRAKGAASRGWKQSTGYVYGIADANTTSAQIGAKLRGK